MPASLLTRLFDLEHRDARITIQKILIIASLLTFLASLYLPAIRVHLDETDQGTVGPGVQCLVMSHLHYPSNILLYTGPLWCWILRQRRGPTMGAMLTILAIISLCFVAMSPTMIDHIFPLDDDGRATFLSGFYVWLAAHLLMTLAIALPLWGEDRRKEMQQLRGELEALERKWVPTNKAA